MNDKYNWLFVHRQFTKQLYFGQKYQQMNIQAETSAVYVPDNNPSKMEAVQILVGLTHPTRVVQLLPSTHMTSDHEQKL